MGEGGGLERQPSMLSLAQSEGSRSDMTTRQGRDPEKSFIVQSKNYYKQVSENKEISKLTSLLSTAINSTKKVGFLLQMLVIPLLKILQTPNISIKPSL